MSNTVSLGRRIREEWSAVPLIDKDLKDHIQQNFQPGEFIEARIQPDAGKLYLLGTNNQTSVQLKLQQSLQYIGNFNVQDMKTISLFWVEEARQKFSLFRNSDYVDIYYYPDYKWLKIENTASGQVEYVTGVVFVIQ